MKPFPTYRLNAAITDAMSKIITIDIASGIATGLDSMIHFVDESGGPLTTIAEITDYPNILTDGGSSRYVKISATYTQLLWMLCSIALRNHDSIVIESEIERMSPEERSQFIKELRENNSITEYQRELVDKKGTFALSADMINRIEVMTQRAISETEMDELYRYDMESEIGIRINSMYVYAMVFCLLHEFSHHSLNHDFQHEGTLQEEIEADSNSFWSIYSDLDGAEKNTAIIGILCSLVSLIFVNKSLRDDGIHPLPIKRIFTYYDLIKDENTKYAGLLCHLFYAWAVYVHDDNMPKLEGPYNETLDMIRAYMLEKEHQANNPVS